MRGGWESWAQEIPAARMFEKKTAKNIVYGLRKGSEWASSTLP